MNAPSFDIADLLEAEESGWLVFKENLFIEREPSTPNNCATIFDTGGRPPQLNLKDQGLEFPSIQIRVRDQTYQNGWIRIEKIKNALHGRANEVWNGTLYSISCANGPFFLDWDELGRVRFVVNFDIQRRKETNS